jgi:hypothetical protein
MDIPDFLYVTPPGYVENRDHVSKRVLSETYSSLNSRVNPNTLHNMSCDSYDLISWIPVDRVDFPTELLASSLK